jgi:NAD(P)-dependent dehydrogenase (short-subunit alcohol dehydrogenase family)
MMIEVNRKLDWFSMVRKLDRSQDIPADLSGLRCILTGGSRGIGWETAKLLHQRGAHIIIATSVKPGPGLQQLSQRLIHQLHHETGQDHDGNPANNDDRLELWHLDLARFDSVIQFAERFRKTGRDLNILINNAGQMYAPFRVTVDGFESHWEVNYLSHSLLIALLLPILKSTARRSGRMSRIVNVASSTHYCRNLNFDDVNGFNLYSPYHAYAQSKLAQIMFTYKLHQLLQSTDTGSHVTANCMHPGVAKTELYENVWWVKAFPFVADLLFRVRTTK